MTISWKYLKCLVPIVTCSSIAVGCFQTDYTKLVKSELAKDIRKDSLLLGIRFGDTRNTFYGKCFDLNKAKLITPGPGNASVKYMFKDSLVHQELTEVQLLFHPTYDKNDIIAEMNMEFSYPGWAPWNRPLQSDSLRPKIMKLLMHWYKGNEFVTAHVNDRDVPVKVDGNRRLMVDIKDAQSVVVQVQDILHPYFRHSISQKEN